MRSYQILQLADPIQDRAIILIFSHQKLSAYDVL